MTAVRSLILVACLGVLGGTSCTGIYARGYAGYMRPTLSGDMALAASSSSATTATADVRDDLGLDTGDSPYVRAEVGASALSLTTSAFRYDGTGTGLLNGGFGDIPGGVAVRSDTTVTNVKAALTFNLIDLGVVRLSPGLGVDYFDVDMNVSALGFSASEEISVQAPAPMLFVQGEADVGPVAATLDVGGLQASLGDADGTFFDVEGLLRFNPSMLFDPPVVDLELFAGYRFITIDASGQADGQNFDADLALSGWFVGGGVTF